MRFLEQGQVAAGKLGGKRGVSSLLATALLCAGLSVPSASVLGQQVFMEDGQPVKGTNVTRVGTATTSYTKTPSGTWWIDEAATRTAYGATETGRDEWSVYLRDEKGRDIQIDLFRRMVSVTPKGMAKTDIGAITLAKLAPQPFADPYTNRVSGENITGAGILVNGVNWQFEKTSASATSWRMRQGVGSQWQDLVEVTRAAKQVMLRHADGRLFILDAGLVTDDIKSLFLIAPGQQPQKLGQLNSYTRKPVAVVAAPPPPPPPPPIPTVTKVIPATQIYAVRHSGGGRYCRVQGSTDWAQLDASGKAINYYGEASRQGNRIVLMHKSLDNRVEIDSSANSIGYGAKTGVLTPAFTITDYNPPCSAPPAPPPPPPPVTLATATHLQCSGIRELTQVSQDFWQWREADGSTKRTYVMRLRNQTDMILDSTDTPTERLTFNFAEKTVFRSNADGSPVGYYAGGAPQAHQRLCSDLTGYGSEFGQNRTAPATTPPLDEQSYTATSVVAAIKKIRSENARTFTTTIKDFRANYGTNLADLTYATNAVANVFGAGNNNLNQTIGFLDHPGGLTRTRSGRIVTSMSRASGVADSTCGVLMYSEPFFGNANIGWSTTCDVSKHPSAMQAVGEIVAVAEAKEIKFFKLPSNGQPYRELKHLTLTDPATAEYEVVGITYNPVSNRYYAFAANAGVTQDSGAARQKIRLCETPQGKALSDPTTRFGDCKMVDGVTLASQGAHLITQTDGSMFIVSNFSTNASPDVKDSGECVGAIDAERFHDYVTVTQIGGPGGLPWEVGLVKYSSDVGITKLNTCVTNRPAWRFGGSIRANQDGSIDVMWVGRFNRFVPMTDDIEFSGLTVRP